MDFGRRSSSNAPSEDGKNAPGWSTLPQAGGYDAMTALTARDAKAPSGKTDSASPTQGKRNAFRPLRCWTAASDDAASAPTNRRQCGGDAVRARSSWSSPSLLSPLGP